MDKEKLFKEVLEKQEVNFLDDNVYHLPQYEQFLHNFLDIIAEELGREFVPKKNYNPLYKSTPILFPQEIFAPAMKQIADEQLRLEGYNVLAEKRPHMESYLSRLIDIIEEKIDPATRYHASLTDLTDEELKDLAKKRVYNALKLMKIDKKPEIVIYDRAQAPEEIKNLLGWASPSQNKIGLSTQVVKAKDSLVPFHEAAHLKYEATQKLQNIGAGRYDPTKDLAQILAEMDKGHFWVRPVAGKKYIYSEDPGLSYELFRQLKELLNKK